MESTAGGMWSMEDLDILASDLDSSLSGLGSSTSPFDMSDALSAIQVIKMSKGEDLHREQWMQHISFSENLGRSLNKERAKSAQDLSSWNFPSSPQRTSKTVKKPCCKREEDVRSDNKVSSEVSYEDGSSGEATTLSNILNAPTSLSQYSLRPGFTMEPPKALADFQYILAAATASITKVGEDTLTYLNQGQPYEIRLKKLQGISEMRGKLLKSILRVGFQERRLQFREEMEIIAWQKQRPAERILDIDLSLSYGIFDVIPDPKNINSCEFMWDPTREASVFLKVNCISTEFTSKRRGGEKGVPFRILIETYSHWENPAHKLDGASCLVKVFKSKGADRKHKTDKEKLEKLPQVEQSDLQPSYQCTVFTPCSVTIQNIPFQDFSQNMPLPSYSSLDSKPESPSMSTTEVTTSTPSITSSPQHVPDMRESFEGVFSPGSDDSGILSSLVQTEEKYVTENLNADDIHLWLARNKFSKYLPSFSLYSGKDLLCLSREDLIEICGAADGIRLYNKLHIREPPPLRKLYISRDKITFYAVYLHTMKCTELQEELSKVLRLSHGAIGDMYVTGPNGILLVITDNVLRNLKDESTYICDILKAEENELYTIILKTYKNIPLQES